MNLKDEVALFGMRLPEQFDLDAVASKLKKFPARNTAGLVTLSSLLFYIAERDHNPKVNDIWDAGVYCSTCLSVGYGDIFAKTPLGKIIGTVLMTIGPALSGSVLDGAASNQADTTQNDLLVTMKQLLVRLGNSNGTAAVSDAPVEQLPARNRCRGEVDPVVQSG
jgi:hypothetical protein